MSIIGETHYFEDPNIDTPKSRCFNRNYRLKMIFAFHITGSSIKMYEKELKLINIIRQDEIDQILTHLLSNIRKEPATDVKCSEICVPHTYYHSIET